LNIFFRDCRFYGVLRRLSHGTSLEMKQAGKLKAPDLIARIFFWQISRGPASTAGDRSPCAAV
jgi:hypothetical protein